MRECQWYLSTIWMIFLKIFFKLIKIILLHTKTLIYFYCKKLLLQNYDEEKDMDEIQFLKYLC